MLYTRPIAHRGLHDKSIPENSLESFENAIKNNYNIETDVHLLKSGEVVIFHDFTLKRMCNKNVSISDLTLDDIKSDEYLLPNGQHIPLLSEVIDFVNGKTGLLVELKITFGSKLEKAVHKLIKGKESWIYIQSFKPTIISYFNKNAPEFERGILSDNIVFPITKLFIKKMQPDFISYGVKNTSKVSLHKLMKKYKMNLLTWTINTEDKVNKSINDNANNIIFEKVDLDKIEFNMEKLQKPKYDKTI